MLFLFVSLTGVALGFPQTTQALFAPRAAGAQGPGPGFQAAPAIEPLGGGPTIGADGAVALARQAKLDAIVSSVTLPARPNQPITVALGSGGERPSLLYVDPYRSEILPARAPQGRPRGIDWEGLHGGDALGPVWRFLVFLVGFLPLLFAVTGVSMWFKKRAARMPMGKPIA